MLLIICPTLRSVIKATQWLKRTGRSSKSSKSSKYMMTQPHGTLYITSRTISNTQSHTDLKECYRLGAVCYAHVRHAHV